MINENEIIFKFREGNGFFIRHYFYEYCRVAYHIFDRKYGLSRKENLDFMSLAHQYAIYLIQHDWKPLEDRSPNVSLRTWMINGFRYIVLDALKWYKKEYGTITFEDYLKTFDLDQNLRLNFNKIIRDISDSAGLDERSKKILVMLLIDGFKSKEVAACLGITPSAVSQRYNTLKSSLLIPYFKKNYDMDLDLIEVIDVDSSMASQIEIMPEFEPMRDVECSIRPSDSYMNREYINRMKKRTTPEHITHLQSDEIFVFGSNLRGMHGGGAALAAWRYFGAVMGQGVGLQGQSYAIPTMQGGVETIKPYVDEFIVFAQQHPELTFLVTRIGCGIAGFDDDDISPLFQRAHDIDNIVLPEGW